MMRLPSVGRPSGVTSSALRFAGVATILIASWLAFAPALHGGWLWDDSIDLTENQLLRSPSGLWKIWFQPAGLYDYYPIKFTVQWLQWHLWHTNTFGYHATNVLLHATSALLVWRILRRLGVVYAWLGGILFAVHPLTVESVAWITELKNTLSLPLLLLSFDCYLTFAENGRWRSYAASLALFLAAMLCKTSVVMFPAFLVLFNWWRKTAVNGRSLLTLAPYFAVSLILGFVTWQFQQQVSIGGHAEPFNPIGRLPERLVCAGSALFFYLGKTVAPISLLPMYPQWSLGASWLWLTWPVLAVALGWFWLRRETWGRHALLGAGWFLLFAAPILGFVTISSQRFTWVMDHLVYVPLVGLIGFAVAGAGWLVARMPRRWHWAAGFAAACVCVALIAGSRAHAAHFQNEEVLWSYTVKQNRGAWLAYFNLGKLQQESGRTEAAIASYQTALRLHPDYADPYYNLGNLLRDTGQLNDAITAYRRAIELKPNLPEAHGNLGVTLFRAGLQDEAIAECQRAIALAPNYAGAHYNLGSILVALDRSADAAPHFAATLRINPAYPGAENNYAIALSDLGQNAEAAIHFERALVATPNDPAVHNNFGATLRDLDRLPEAIGQFQQAVKLRPDYLKAWMNLGAACSAAHRYADAVVAFQRALQLSPENISARLNLAAASQAASQLQEATHENETKPALQPTSAPSTR